MIHPLSKELQALHEMVQQKVVTLLSDPENIVKQTLMENGITRLCVFFGRQKANDVLLSHMITFLNDKNDWHLRGAFFDSIVGRLPSQSLHIISDSHSQHVTKSPPPCRCSSICRLAEFLHPEASSAARPE